MHPARFVTLCFLYSGAVLLAQGVVFSPLRLDGETVWRVSSALPILFIGLYRLRYPEKEERKPTEYGPLAYGMAVLSLVLTAILLAQLFAV